MARKHSPLDTLVAHRIRASEPIKKYELASHDAADRTCVTATVRRSAEIIRRPMKPAIHLLSRTPFKNLAKSF